MLSKIRNLFVTLKDDVAQDAFEYALVIGGVSVAVVIAIAAASTAAPGVVTGMCDAIATIPGMGSVSC